MNVLVIGGAGYIGSHAVLELCENEHDVTVFDNLSSGYLLNIDSRAKFIQGDILQNDDLKNVFNEKFEAVFHFAALISVPESLKNPKKYYLNNYIKSKIFIDNCIANNVKYFIYSSSAAIYQSPKKILI